MKAIRWLGVVALAALPLFFAAGRHVASAAPDCVNGAAGLAAYYFDGSKGTLNLSDGRTWVITLTGIDGSAVTGNKTYHLLVQDHGTGSGWETLPTQTHHDFYGAGGHLLQSDDNGWTVRSSHGFNPGDVLGTYDLRVVMTQRTDDKWDISPYFRLPGGNWTLFYDGAWTTATAFDLTKTRVAVGIDGGGGGTLCFNAPTASAVDLTNVFVDDDWVGLPNGEEVLFPGDPNPHYIGLDAFAAIQDGISNVQGSTVNVADGVYTATSLASIVITKDGLSLIGQSRDGTIIDAGPWGTSGAGWPTGIHVYANDVAIRNLTVRGFTGDTVNTGGYGIVFRDWAHDTPGEGYIFYSGGIVENVKLENNYSSLYALVHRNLTVRDSLIQNSLSDGVFIARESDNATVTGNTVLNSGDHGIWVGYCWQALGPSDNATITGNVVDGAREGGISFVGSNTALISENDVSHVKGEEPEGAGGWSRGAISLKDGVSNVTVSNNVVHDNDGLGTGSGRGIGVDGTSSNITIVGNIIRNNAGGGLKVMGTTSGWAANSNSIHSNAGYGAQNATGALLDFSGNWWGINTPTDVAGQVSSANVDYTPWLDSSTDKEPGTRGFQGDFSTLDVDDDSPQSGATGRIQEGVNMVSGSTVNVAAGTYTEQLDIGKPLTLTGAGQASTIIKSPAALATKFANNKPVVYIHDASGVTVQQLTVDGDGKGNANYRMEGIAFYNAGGTVDHVTITRMRDTPLSGAQHGVGLYANNADGAPRTLNISNNTIGDYQKNGMALSGAGLTATVTGNTVTGSGPTSVIAQNGIQVGFGATGTVEDNTVSAMSYTGGYWGASGILVTSYSAWGYPPSSADLTSNTVTNAQVGIYYGEGSGEADGNIVSASAAGVGMPAFWGIVVVDPPGLSASPFEDEAAPPAGGGAAAPMGAGVMTVVVSGNILTGDGSAGSVGLETDAGYGPENVSFTASGNTISNWGTGVVVAQCTSGCSGAVFTSVDVGPDNNVSAPIADPSNAGLHAMGTVNLNVHNNTFTGGYDAIKLRLSVTGTVKDNVVSGYAKNGITVGKGADDNTGTNVTVSGNTVTGGGPGQVNAQNGIQVGPNAVARIENNTVSNHVYTLGTGACAGPGTKGDAAYYAACYTAAGVLLYQGTATVTGNVITGNQVGVDDSGAEVHYNIIRDNVIYGMNNSGSSVANAENNWWGSCDGPGPVGPGSGDAVSTLVDYDPWLHGACDTDGDLLTDDAEQLTWFTDWQDRDTDDDGCADGEEALYAEPSLGGQRDPLNPWDFYDVPTLAIHTVCSLPGICDPVPTRDRGIGITTDVVALLEYAGAVDTGSDPRYNVDLDGNTVLDGLEYDRMTSTYPDQPWRSGPPDGGIGITTDVIAMLAQAGHSCAAPP